MAGKVAIVEDKEEKPGQDFFNVELRFLSEDVREAFQKTRNSFMDYMLGKVRAVYFVHRLDDLLVCLIATNRFSRKEIKEIEDDIHQAHMLCDAGGNTKDRRFVMIAHKDMKKISWLIADKNLFRKGLTDKGKMETRV